MKIGYACLNIGVQNTQYKTCRIDNATDERLAELISHNLCSLEKEDGLFNIFSMV